jgi:hypothetical protein
MPKLPLLLAAAGLLTLASCVPPPPPPPPRFQPNPPYPPQPVAPENDPYGTQPAPAPAPAPAPTTPGSYPTASLTANPDQVISPYEPFNVIDISGPPRITSGKLARDPSNGKIFRVP